MLTRQIVIEIPEQILLVEKMNAEQFAAEMRLLTAVKLFELGRLSSGRAAQLAGLPRVEFLICLEQYQLFPLEAELEELEMYDA